jgi:hypothetical protein
MTWEENKVREQEEDSYQVQTKNREGEENERGRGVIKSLAPSWLTLFVDDVFLQIKHKSANRVLQNAIEKEGNVQERMDKQILNLTGLGVNIISNLNWAFVDIQQEEACTRRQPVKIITSTEIEEVHERAGGIVLQLSLNSRVLSRTASTQ